MRLTLGTFRRRGWVFVNIVLAAALGGAVRVVLQHPRYEGTASVLVPGQMADARDLRLARSGRTVNLAVGTRAGAGMSRRSFLEHSRVRGRGAALEFAVTDASPARAAALATAYARAYAGVRRQLATVAPAAKARQIAPRPARTMGVALLLGGVGAVVIVLLFDALDPRIRKPEEVSSALGLRLLGTIPHPKAAPRGELVVRAQPYGEEADAYRGIRTNLEVLTADARALSLMITSALNYEGRTTTAANLALVSAFDGRNVVLVDLHLRHPALAALFSLEGRPGLGEVLEGRLPLASALVPVPLDDAWSSAGQLAVLPAGSMPVDAADAGTSVAVASVVRELRENHDLVLLDAPPLVPVVEARILSGAADALVVVTNLIRIRRPFLRHLSSAMAECAAPAIGVIATGVEQEEADRYRDYYYERRRTHRRTRAGLYRSGSTSR